MFRLDPRTVARRADACKFLDHRTAAIRPEPDPELQRGTPMDATTKARLLAVELLLAEPELLGNDALETDLYMLRDQLQASAAREP